MMNQTQNQFSFDLNTVEDVNGGAIPGGIYRAQVEKAELKPTKAGTGSYIETQFTITDEKQNGRKFWELFNIQNPNPEAVKIGLGRIKALIVASGGQPGLFNSEQALIGLECLVNLKVTVDEYGEKNKIVGFKPLPSEIQQSQDGMNGNPPF